MTNEDTQDAKPLILTKEELQMKVCDAESKEELKESFAELDQYLEQENKDLNKRRVGAWLISFATHAFIGLVFSIIVFAQMNNEDKFEYPPMQIAINAPPPPDVKPKDKLPVKLMDEIPNNIKELEKADDKPIVPIIMDATITEEAFEMPKGELDNVSVSELGGKGFNFAIGAGRGGGGIYGDRIGGNKRKAAISGYGPKARGAESAVDAALKWLAKHQSADGSWDAINYYKNCSDEGEKCEPGAGAKGDANIALTGYAILCFAGNGHDHHTPTVFKKNVSAGIAYLLNNQNKDGSFGERNYEHAVATQAICELIGLSGDTTLKTPAQKAIDIILSRQAQDGKYGLAWDYINPNPARNDFSVSGWNIFALKAGMAAGLNIKGGLNGSKAAVEGAWKAANPNWKEFSDPYNQKSCFPYVWNSINGKTEKDHLSFVGACSLVFLGHKNGDIMLNTMLNDMNARFLDNDEFKTNAYALYYAVLASFQIDKDCFNKWQEKFIPWLIQTQYKDGCKRGTWNYPEQRFHGWDTSRILIHCYLTLSMEVVYRYKLIK